MSTELTRWQALGRLKLEFGLMILCVLQLVKLPIVLVMKGSELKVLYDAMTAEIPEATLFVLNACDFVVSYWFILMPVLLIGGLILGTLCMYMLTKMVIKKPDAGITIGLQYLVITVCFIFVLSLFLVESSITTYLMYPLVKLTSAF